MSAECDHEAEVRTGRSEWTDPLDGRKKATVTRRCHSCGRRRWTAEPINATLSAFGGDDS
jgi:hypothetical protein